MYLVSFAREGRMTVTIGRRELLVALGGAAVWPLAAQAQMAQANHTSGEENSPRLSAKNPDSSRYGGSIRKAAWSAGSLWPTARGPSQANAHLAACV
jgi:hypothetical protein